MTAPIASPVENPIELKPPVAQGLLGQQLTLMEELRATTFLAHAGLQAVPFFPALAACQLPMESYVGQLRALAAIHGFLEQVMAHPLDPRISSVWQHDMCKVPQLQRDLRYFEPRMVADLREAVDATHQTVESLRLRSVRQPLALLGWLYVLEGSTLGAVVLRPLYARAFLLTGEDGLAYLNPYGKAVHARWEQYQQRMNGLRLSAAERGQISEGASEAFGHLAAIFRALYPFSPESRTLLATAINPEAGRHSVPADPREVGAAIRAGDLCWARYPYFEHRYGERGRRFARSDAAWQATLHQFDAEQISQQVRWLGRVLAGRGMPTCLLQDQLELLVAELTVANPAKKAEYAKLLPAAAELLAVRRQHLSDGQMQALAAEFDQAVGPEWSARFPSTGQLLGCAVADELAGSPLAVVSLRAWMADANRFPPRWIQAVEATLARARQQARTATNPDMERI